MKDVSELDNVLFLESLYSKFLQDPLSVDPSWHEFFANYHGNILLPGETNYSGSQLSRSSAQLTDKFDAIVLIAYKLVEAYRRFGHTAIEYDPLSLQHAKPQAELELQHFDISVDWNEHIAPVNGLPEICHGTLNQLLDKLKHIYANRIGLEFYHLESYDERQWLQNYLEHKKIEYTVNAKDRIKALHDVTQTEQFENYLHKKFPGAKRFSAEGAEVVIAAVNFISESCMATGAEEIVLAMAHRGRLSTLTGVMGKPYRALFAEFAGSTVLPENFSIPGDVKYHMGYSTDKTINGKNLHLSLLPNPSHLELVNSVALGKARAKQDLLGDIDCTKVVGLHIHGDAAFAGQGSVPEALALSQLNAFHTGGTIHLIINNQIGFTTNPVDARGGRYCSDIAKSISCPIFHINGGDVDAVLFACQLAVEYRQRFKKDVVLDIVCYRKYGHNEGDEPMFTQPKMYLAVTKQTLLSKNYGDKLLNEKVLDREAVSYIKSEIVQKLDNEFILSQGYKNTEVDWLQSVWKGFEPPTRGAIEEQPITGVALKILEELTVLLSRLPDKFNVNSKILRQLEARVTAVKKAEPFDWGTGEVLAMATLLAEGFNIRMSGQDAQRGTFSHRHSVLTDQSNENSYCPLASIGTPGKVQIYNSNLSELAVLGFEYGYSITRPDTLSIWEAQFGDFANGAQMIIDQYIASAEAKWLRMSGLVLLLPHGYEGQGPEHSSARLERYLQLCAVDNIQVVNCSTPASFFHVLRRQMHRKFKKPLIVMTPKSLLRKPLSTIHDLKEGTSFEPVIDEMYLSDHRAITRIILCSGKVYYDLLEKRNSLKLVNVALVRLEQLYPFPTKKVAELFEKYERAEIIWCQEEHKNMGAYTFVYHKIKYSAAQVGHGSKEIYYVGREESASPSTGYSKTHLAEREIYLDRAFAEVIK
jgi:2-oxoglutarate dehydrogenase E1 component